MKQCLQSVNHEQFPVQMTQDNKHNKWYEILDFQPKLLQRTPTKIHRERRRRRQQETPRKAQRASPGAQLLTSLSTAKATSLTQWSQTCAEAATKYYCDYNPEYLEPKAPSTPPPPTPTPTHTPPMPSSGTRTDWPVGLFSPDSHETPWNTEISFWKPKVYATVQAQGVWNK